MSLNQKYTWHNFLKDHPELKEKGVKRTSAEGKKAFDSAYKAFVKKYFTERAEKLTKEIARASKKRDAYVLKLKEVSKSGKKLRTKFAQKKVGRTDKCIAGLKKQQEKIKIKQKNF